MINQIRMRNCGLHCLEVRFFENRGVKRMPAGILTLRNNPVLGPQDAAVGLSYRKNLSAGVNRSGPLWMKELNHPSPKITTYHEMQVPVQSGRLVT
jgi:hypothetical protein